MILKKPNNQSAIICYIQSTFFKTNKNSFVVYNIGLMIGPVMNPKIPRGLSEQLILKNHLSMVGWLHSKIWRPCELRVYDMWMQTPNLPRQTKVLLQISHTVSAQSIFISVGELDKNSIINFMGTKEEKLILKVLLTCLLQINYSDCTDCFTELQDLQNATQIRLAVK